MTALCSVPNRMRPKRAGLKTKTPTIVLAAPMRPSYQKRFTVLKTEGAGKTGCLATTHAPCGKTCQLNDRDDRDTQLLSSRDGAIMRVF
jgi:hypothetical protein